MQNEMNVVPRLSHSRSESHFNRSASVSWNNKGKSAQQSMLFFPHKLLAYMLYSSAFPSSDIYFVKVIKSWNWRTSYLTSSVTKAFAICVIYQLNAWRIMLATWSEHGVNPISPTERNYTTHCLNLGTDPGKTIQFSIGYGHGTSHVARGLLLPSGIAHSSPAVLLPQEWGQNH